MNFLNFTSKYFSTKAILISKKLPLFSFPTILFVEFDISVVFIVVVLVGVITFLAGTAYGIYLNDKISSKDTSKQLTGS